MRQGIALGQRWLSSAPHLIQEGPQIACLQDIRRVIRLSGAPLVHFLQGLITSDATPLESPDSPPLYACILNPQGRYLHDLFLFRTTEEAPTPTVLVDTDAAGAEDLLRLLKRYRLRQKIDIDDVSGECNVWVKFGGKEENSGNNKEENTDITTSEATSSVDEAASWPRDPRLLSLGHRTVLPSSAFVPLEENNATVVPWQAYRKWRLAAGVAEGDSEIPTGDAIALEYNIDGLHGISFTKGCYVGQELMARTHFKGVVRKRVMPFTLEGYDGGGTAAMDVRAGHAVYDTTTPSAGKSIGTVRVVDGGLGLVHVRLSAALTAIQEGRTLRTEGGADVRLKRPKWWPPSWGLEDR